MKYSLTTAMIIVASTSLLLLVSKATSFSILPKSLHAALLNLLPKEAASIDEDATVPFFLRKKNESELVSKNFEPYAPNFLPSTSILLTDSKTLQQQEQYASAFPPELEQEHTPPPHHRRDPIVSEEMIEEMMHAADQLKETVMTEVVTPLLFQEDIEKGVAADVIKGAVISGVSLGILASQGAISAAIGSGLGAAYLCITPGKMGDIVRNVGGFSWNVCQQVMDAFDKYETSQKVTAVTVAMAKGIIDNVVSLKHSMDDNNNKWNEVELNVQQVLEASDEALKRADQRAKSELAARGLLAARLELEAKSKAQKSKARSESTARSLLVARLELEAKSKAQKSKARSELTARRLLVARLELEKKSKTRAKDEVKVLGEARLTESRAKTKAFAKLVADQKIRLAEKAAELREAQEAAATHEKATLLAEEAKQDARLVSEQALLVEEERIAVAARLAVEKAEAEREEARLAAVKAEEEAIEAEQARQLAEEERIAVAARLAVEKAEAEREEARLAAVKAEEEAIEAEQARQLAEEERIAVAARLAVEKAEAEREDARLAALKAEEEAGIAEAALLALEMEKDAMYFDEDDWEASIQLATQDIEGKIVGLDSVPVLDNEKDDWNKASQFAQDLAGDAQSTKEDLEAQAKAAQAAVDLFEAERKAAAAKHKTAAAKRRKQEEQWIQDMVSENSFGLAEDLETIKAAVNELEVDNEFPELDMAALGAAARAAVEKMERSKAARSTVVEEDEEDLYDAFDPEELEAVGAAARAAVEQMDVPQGNEFDDELEAFDSVDLEALGNAARAAVEKMNEQNVLVDKDFAEYEEFDDVDTEIDMMQSSDEDDTLDEFDIDALGASARRAVDMFNARTAIPSKNWSTMTVADLKSALVARGIKATGKKAELIALLERASLVTSPIEEDFGAFAVDDIDFDADEPSEAELMQLEENPVSFDDDDDDETVGLTATVINVDGLTMPQLKAELKMRGLATGGRKADLVKRLKANL